MLPYWVTVVLFIAHQHDARGMSEIMHVFISDKCRRVERFDDYDYFKIFGQTNRG